MSMDSDDPLMLKSIEEERGTPEESLQVEAFFQNHHRTEGEQGFENDSSVAYQNPEEALKEAVENGNAFMVTYAPPPPPPPLPLLFYNSIPSEDAPAIFGAVEPLPNPIDFGLFEIDVQDAFSDDFEFELPLDEELDYEMANDFDDFIANESIIPSHGDCNRECPESLEATNENCDHQEGHCGTNCCENFNEMLIQAFFDKPSPLSKSVRDVHLHFNLKYDIPKERYSYHDTLPLSLAKLKKDSYYFIDVFSNICFLPDEKARLILPQLYFKIASKAICPVYDNFEDECTMDYINDLKWEDIRTSKQSSDCSSLTSSAEDILNNEPSFMQVAIRDENCYSFCSSMERKNDWNDENGNSCFFDKSIKENNIVDEKTKCCTLKSNASNLKADEPIFDIKNGGEKKLIEKEELNIDEDLKEIRKSKCSEISLCTLKADENFEPNDLRYLLDSDVSTYRAKLWQTSSLAVNMNYSQTCLDISSSDDDSFFENSKQISKKSHLKDDGMKGDRAFEKYKTSKEVFKTKGRSRISTETRMKDGETLNKAKPLSKLSRFSRRLRYFWSLIFK